MVQFMNQFGKKTNYSEKRVERKHSQDMAEIAENEEICECDVRFFATFPIRFCISKPNRMLKSFHFYKWSTHDDALTPSVFWVLKLAEDQENHEQAEDFSELAFCDAFPMMMIVLIATISFIKKNDRGSMVHVDDKGSMIYWTCPPFLV